MTLSIVHPLPIAAITGAGIGASNLLTPDPKEAFLAAGSSPAIVVDLGAAAAFDTIFVGYTDAPSSAVLSVTPGASGGAPINRPFAHSYRRQVRRHAIVSLDQPITNRYLRISITGGGSTIGVVAVGLSIRPEGYDWGGGRPITDGSRVDRLQAGGFGIDSAAVAGGFAWTMPGLTDDEVERLYALSLDVGTRTSVLVVEGDDARPGSNERLHWGLLTKLEPHARQAPDENKWSMQVQDWA